MLQVNFFGKQSVYLVGCRVSFTRTIKVSDGKELSPINVWGHGLKSWALAFGLGQSNAFGPEIPMEIA